MKEPLISVIMASYNHEKYVNQAIESVLAQQGVSFELLIADDGSKDNTCTIIETMNDERIYFTRNEKNIGQFNTTNALIEKSKGEFIAILNSDDFWHDPLKLKKQLTQFANNPKLGACFSHVRIVDKQSQEKSSKLSKIFNQPNRTQAEWLRLFFEKGNVLCHPAVLMRKECHEKCGLYDVRLRQLPDFDLWVKLIKHYELHIIEENLISFRETPEQASSNNDENNARLYNELFLLGESFFDNMPQALFYQTFADIVKFPEAKSDNHFEIDKSLALFNSPHIAFALSKMEIIYNYLNVPVMKKLLQDDYNYNDLTFQKRMSEIKLVQIKEKSKLKKFIKGLFN